MKYKTQSIIIIIFKLEYYLIDKCIALISN